MTDDLQTLLAQLNGETARIPWSVLQRHYARGVLVTVHPDLDLVTIAAHMARDEAAAITSHLDAGDVHRSDVDEARDWHARDAMLWAVVVAPWVLVQKKA